MPEKEFMKQFADWLGEFFFKMSVAIKLASEGGVFGPKTDETPAAGVGALNDDEKGRSQIPSPGGLQEMNNAPPVSADAAEQDAPPAEEKESEANATPAEAKEPEAKAPPKEPAITYDILRALCSEKSHSGFTAQIKALIENHGSVSLSFLDPASYDAMYREVKALK